MQILPDQIDVVPDNPAKRSSIPLLIAALEPPCQQSVT